MIETAWFSCSCRWDCSTAANRRGLQYCTDASTSVPREASQLLTIYLELVYAIYAHQIGLLCGSERRDEIK